MPTEAVNGDTRDRVIRLEAELGFARQEIAAANVAIAEVRATQLEIRDAMVSAKAVGSVAKGGLAVVRVLYVPVSAALGYAVAHLGFHFHEFGHALHGLFAAQTYPTLSGTNVARDFVEFPSQFNENWALDPKILPHYAVHYQTGQVLPADLIAKIKQARTFNQGYDNGEVLEAARLDLDWHSLPATAGKQDVDRFEADALAKSGFDVADVPPRYRSNYFLHIWANGYSAGYYAYPWTRMLGQDAFAWFESHGGLTRANGQRFRDMVLSRGNTQDYAAMYKAFAGRDPDINPYLQYYGLTGAGAAPATPASAGGK